MQRVGYALLAAAVLGCLVLGGFLFAFERAGPTHRDVTLPGGVPATLYLPDASAPQPAVVVGHGYSGDRASMSSLSRSLAEAGYAVLAIDFAGHGASRASAAEVDGADELARAFDWLETSGEVDGGRLAVLGHSMGAYAALEAVARDPRPEATVAVGSARSEPFGGREPPNLLLLAGENESSSTLTGSAALARAVDGARFEEVDGANHISTLWSDETVAETVAWLDGVFENARAAPAEVVDARLDLLRWYLLCVPLAVVALGLAAARLAPRVARERPPRLRDVAFIAAALVVAAPVAVFLEPAGFLGEGYGDVVSYLVVAGAVLYLPQIPGPFKPAPPNATLARLAASALAATAGAFLLFAPTAGVLHRIVPTFGRVILGAIVTPLLGLFFVQLQAILRRGPLVHATVAAAGGHVLVLSVLAAGVVLDVFPGVVGVALPLLAGVFVLVELFGVAAYHVTRNGVLVGVVESVWVGGLVAAVMPLPP